MKRPLICAVLLLGSLTAAARAQIAATKLADDTAANHLILTVGPVDLPVGVRMSHGAHGGVYPPLTSVALPFTGYLYALSYEIVDGRGHTLPRELLHHLNLFDPEHRELFLPIARRMVAVSKETPPLEMPPDLMGYPVTRGQHIDVSAMLHNPTDRPYHDVSVRVHIKYRTADQGAPEYEVYPFHLDVAFPVGAKSFDVPPGRHSWSNEGSPAVAGSIMGIGSHYHDWVQHIVFEDLTAGAVLWVGCPVEGPEGEVERSTIGRFYEAYEAVPGIHISPAHRYRVTVTYDNQSGRTLPDGGMGVVAGVFVPDSGVQWPALDTLAPLYRLDRRHYLHEISGTWADIAGELWGRPDLHTIQRDAPPSPALRRLPKLCPWEG